MQPAFPERRPSPAEVRQKNFTRPLFALGFVWVVTVLTGLGFVTRYDTRPGQAGHPTKQWPEQSTLMHGGQAPQLLMFAHPKCPCTRSSIGELAHIMAQCQNQVEARVLFFCPEGHDASWTASQLIKSAQRIPGVSVVMDRDGKEARRFGTRTSGHALLFDQRGLLTFSGGITGSRGHAGDNVGRSAIVSQLTKRAARVPGAAGRQTCAIYGCEILNEPPL